MAFEYRPRAGLCGAVFASLLASLAACQSGSGSNDNAVAGVDATAPPPPTEKVTQSELLAYCPSVTVRQGTANFTTYAKGGDGDAGKVVYQASIGEATRACSRADGTMTIKVGVAGRVVPGPLGTAGTINMPIRVAVSVSGQVVYSELHPHKVTISDTKAATQFLFTDANVSIPVPAQNTARIFVGFDEGPSKKPTADAGADG